MARYLHHALVERREIPSRGPDVHFYDMGKAGHVVLFVDGEINRQRAFDTFAEARTYAFGLADQLDCAMVEHRPYANRETL